MSGISNVKSALVKGFVDGAFFANDKVAWENKSFVPPAQGPWASVFFVPNTPRVITLGPGGRDEVNGFLQIDLNYPPGSGDQEAQAKATAIEEAYKAGSRLAFSGVEVIIQSAGRSSGRIVNSFWRVSVTVFFYSHYNR
jgi:hypothetical protein